MKPQEAAELATEALRALNRTTLHNSFQRPADLYAMIAELTILVRVLPKTLNQAATWLDTQHHGGHLTRTTT